MEQRRRLSHRTIVEMLGDMAVLAPALGITKPNTVAHWKKRARGIPPIHWPAIVREAKRQGFDLTEADLERTSPYTRAPRRRVAA